MRGSKNSYEKKPKNLSMAPVVGAAIDEIADQMKCGPGELVAYLVTECAAAMRAAGTNLKANPDVLEQLAEERRGIGAELATRLPTGIDSTDFQTVLRGANEKNLISSLQTLANTSAEVAKALADIATNIEKSHGDRPGRTLSKETEAAKQEGRGALEGFTGDPGNQGKT